MTDAALNDRNRETRETQMPYENVTVSAYAELVHEANSERSTAAAYEELSPKLTPELTVCSDEGPTEFQTDDNYMC